MHHLLEDYSNVTANGIDEQCFVDHCSVRLVSISFHTIFSCTFPCASRQSSPGGTDKNRNQKTMP